ncbi:recombinase family protein [Mesoflavibacter zeaxanthinifaciens]|uniref:recombinase family protein n=1 Tax=Mesoflavibacter zeaxanthinifaciens TaxID=393060 RepID=UPI00041E6835|nr:recombinase family protein [Mesoflavibacter zeaxanthinifaciens]
MKQVYGYIRVSDVKQKEGTSLIEQKRIIKEFAEKNKLNIIHIYEENKTAAKKGRPLFEKMMQNLKDYKADGVIIHKIDRSARNLHDWANIGDLIDMNIDVFFAHESLNLNERSGRLSADIQAVMASDYIRNLRQETIKGMYGRLKQGYYPWEAPIGYNDNGKGKIKTINHEQADLIQQLFNLYVQGEYNAKALSKKMEALGLKNKRNKRVCKNGILRILKNPFYIGLIKIKGKTYRGNHTPIIDPRVFKQAQLKIEGRLTSKGMIHNYLFRKKIRCELCNYIMSGEMQKGCVYYRCATKGCPTKSIREDLVEHHVKNILKTISLSDKEIQTLKEVHTESKNDWVNTQENIAQGITLKIGQLESKEQKLIDMYLEDVIDKNRYNKQRAKILLELQENKAKKNQLSSSKDQILEEIDNFLELCKSPINIYNSGIVEEKRELLEIVTSNLTANQRKLSFTMVSPYRELAFRDTLSSSAPERDGQRILYGKIVYSDKNTSSVVPKPMNKEQIKLFYKFLCGCASTLEKINSAKDYYALQTDDPNA